MAKLYAFLISCVLSIGLLSAQTAFYWVGPTSGNWNDANNWSTTSGGAGGAGVPTDITHNVIFDTDALVNVDISPNLLSITVTNSSYATLRAFIDVNITLNSTVQASPALKIDVGSTLEDSSAANIDFFTTIAPGAKATVDGTWVFNSVPLSGGSQGAILKLPGVMALGNRLDVNGKIYVGFNCIVDSNPRGEEYIFYNAGSEFHIHKNGHVVPFATWDENSTIRITGNQSSATRLPTTTTISIGNLIYDNPGLITSVSFGFIAATVKGNLDILNTGGRELILSGGGTAGTSFVTNTIMGDLNISGNSRVVVSNNDANNKTIHFRIEGDLNAAGLSFNLQKNIVANTGSPTVMFVGGNINHSAGVFTSSGTVINNSSHLFVIELNGTAKQFISSVTGNFDNANNQVTLRMNNAAGAELLTPLAVGRVAFGTANRGRITTTATNLLTINNTFITSTTDIVVSGLSNTGHVDGPVRRRTATNLPYVMPVGKGGILRVCHVIPETSVLSVYQAEYFPTPYSDLSYVAPLKAVSNNLHWMISRISGSAAAIQLTVPSAIPGAVATDGIVVAHYDGTDWVNAKGSTGTYLPGNATSGTVTSEVLSSFSPFAFGLVNQSALPIHLLTFSGKKLSGNAAQVSWTISNESTPETFEVLSSADGRDFTTIGSVRGTVQKLNYEFVDNNLGSGTTYYRLRMIDIDGEVTYSKVIAVMNGTNGVLITSMIPTVVTGSAKLNISSSKKGNMQLVITDQFGRIIQQRTAAVSPGSQDIALNLHSLSKGVYQVTALFEGQRTATIRFIKQ
jgi:hypothetical protein